MSERRSAPTAAPVANPTHAGAPPSHVAARRTAQRLLNAGWAVVGWYASVVLWSALDVLRHGTLSSLAGSLRAVLLPRPLDAPSVPLWIVAAFALAILAIVSGATWASLTVSRGRAKAARRPKAVHLPWLTPFATGIVVTLGTLVATTGRGVAALLADLGAVPAAVLDTVVLLVLMLVTGMCVSSVQNARRRHREPRSVMQALRDMSDEEAQQPDEQRLLPAFSEDDEVAEDYLRGYLALADKKASYYTDALKRLRSQIEYARNQIMYSEQAALSSPPSFEAAQPASPDSATITATELSQPPNMLARCYNTGDIISDWYTLLGDAMAVVVALAAAFDNVGTNVGAIDARGADQRNLDEEDRHLRASEFVRALRMLLLVRIYALRADINKASNDPRAPERTFQWPGDVIRAITAKRRTYDRLAGLRVLRTALPAGWKEGDDATEYSAWSRPFGTAREGEVGWSPFARTVGYELRYQQHKVELRQRWYEIRAAAPSLLNPIRALGAAALWLFKVTAGFGFKPRRLAGTALGVVAFFSVAYYADEVASACKDGARSIADFPREIVYAIGNLTNLGAAEPCGPTRGVLTSIESVIGIFMLSVLAAMLFAWLTDR